MHALRTCGIASWGCFWALQPVAYRKREGYKRLYLVPGVGLEPTRVAPEDFKSPASTVPLSTIGSGVHTYSPPLPVCSRLAGKSQRGQSSGHAHPLAGFLASGALQQDSVAFWGILIPRVVPQPRYATPAGSASTALAFSFFAPACEDSCHLPHASRTPADRLRTPHHSSKESSSIRKCFSTSSIARS